MTELRIFISYSRSDKRWKDRVVKHLRAFQKPMSFEIWDDQRIEAGKDWLNEITSAVASADVAILLVSTDYLSSVFIQKVEGPALLEQNIRSGVRLVPLLVEPSNYLSIDWISHIEVRPKDGNPLSGRSKHGIEVELAEFAKELVGILGSRSSHPPDPGSRLEQASDALLDSSPTRAGQLEPVSETRGAPDPEPDSQSDRASRPEPVPQIRQASESEPTAHPHPASRLQAAPQLESASAARTSSATEGAAKSEPPSPQVQSPGAGEQPPMSTRVIMGLSYTALTAYATSIFQLPIPQVHAAPGYMNIGDCVVLLGGLRLGPIGGALAGGGGAAFADIISGYPSFALLSFLAHGAEGFLAGQFRAKPIAGVILGGGTMVLAYFLGEYFSNGGYAQASVELPANIAQACLGMIAAAIIYDRIRSKVGDTPLTDVASPKGEQLGLRQRNLMLGIGALGVVGAVSLSQLDTPVALFKRFVQLLQLQLYHWEGGTVTLRLQELFFAMLCSLLYLVGAVALYLALMHLTNYLRSFVQAPLLRNALRLLQVPLSILFFAAMSTCFLAIRQELVDQATKQEIPQAVTYTLFGWTL